MKKANVCIDIEKVYVPSKDVVAREVHGEFVIIPITSCIGELEDEIFSLNKTGLAIWNSLNGNVTLKEVIHALAQEFHAPYARIETDVIGLTQELLKRNIIVEVNKLPL